MDYLIVCKSDNQHFLLMTIEEEVRKIQAYRSKEEVMSAFKGYTEGWSATYERSMSCTIGMMNMQPVAIAAPESPEELKKYITEMKTYSVTGGAMGRGYVGLPVSEDILNLKQFDIWKESMKDGGIM